MDDLSTVDDVKVVLYLAETHRYPSREHAFVMWAGRWMMSEEGRLGLYTETQDFGKDVSH